MVALLALVGLVLQQLVEPVEQLVLDEQGDMPMRVDLSLSILSLVLSVVVLVSSMLQEK